MGFLFKEKIKKRIYIAKDEPESVRLAVYDLQRDICAVCGGAVIVDGVSEADIVVCGKDSGEFSALIGGRVCFTHCEEFFYSVEEEKIFFSGADDLGVVWAIFTFSAKELGVSPSCFFDGAGPEKKSSLFLEEKNVSDYPRTRFRGWFVNDEDLLSGFMNKGERKIDYFFYKKIIDPVLMEKIVETALRFRINLLIPSTLVDIENPAEAALLDVAARRGMYISQHHIEPLGVSNFGMCNFMAENGYDAQNISFVTNRAAMEAAWRHYVKKWAKYPRVVWQLGLRGNSDVPVWMSDKNVGESDEERGKLISDAIFTQYNIIKEEVGKKFYTSMTIWMESANLLSKGVLQLPKDTVVVFADIGASQMYGKDFFSVPREAGRKYGVYWHIAYWNVGPHLAEGVLPEKMEYCYRLARENHADFYSVVNVGNIKEFVWSVGLNAETVFSGKSCPMEKYLQIYSQYFPAETKKDLCRGISDFFHSFGEIGDEEYKNFCKFNNFNYYEYSGLSFPVYALSDGFLCWYIRRPFEDNVKFFNPLMENVFKQGLENMKKAAKRFHKVYKTLCSRQAEQRDVFARQWLYQSLYWRELLYAGREIFIALKRVKFGKKLNRAAHYRRASKHIAKILQARDVYYVGEWKKWFVFDKKLDIPALYAFLREKGETVQKEGTVSSENEG